MGEIYVSVKNYKDFIVWQKAMDLIIEVYRLIKFLPYEENYALSDQIHSTVISIPSNIAEEQGRNSTKEFVKYQNSSTLNLLTSQRRKKYELRNPNIGSG